MGPLVGPGRLHGYLRIRELQARNGEHDLSCSHQGVLGDLEGNVDVVGFHILHLVRHNDTFFL